MTKEILIIGAGPTGLGAAHRLRELGIESYTVLERNNHVGGLAASFSRGGYTMDIGGHVLFSHYPYFDNVVNHALQGDYLEHVREAWIWILSRFVPYPFQNNIKFLPKELVWECIEGLLDLKPNSNSMNFEEWIDEKFGAGIAKYFMKPYNTKVWAHPLTLMSKEWISERVSVIDLKKVLYNVIYDKADTGWGPNNTFKFPLRGGTGAIFNAIADGVREHIQLGKTVVKIDTCLKQVTLDDGEKLSYDVLINTSPLDQFVLSSDLSSEHKSCTTDLLHNSGYSVSIGIRRPLDAGLRTKCWNYFPEMNVPFYRVTYLSNYSPNMVPDVSKHFLLMCETSSSSHFPFDRGTIVEKTIRGLVDSKFIHESDQALIDFTDCIDIDYSYPIPSVHRDRALEVLLPALERLSVYSRGRFGLWRYETGNMDHSFMQGVEVVDCIFQGSAEVTRYKR